MTSGGATQPARAGQRATTTVLRGGALVGGIGFIIGLALALADGQVASGAIPLLDVPSGLVVFDPSAWLTAAAIVLIVTPAAALVTTAVEFSNVDRRSMAVCLLLLLIFGASVILAFRARG